MFLRWAGPRPHIPFPPDLILYVNLVAMGPWLKIDRGVRMGLLQYCVCVPVNPIVQCASI